MNDVSFTTTFAVDRTPDEAFAAINNVRGWWSGGADIIFDIYERADKTEIRFSHVGLVPDYESFDSCSSAWGCYINGSLRDLMTTGKGEPNPKEHGNDQ
jgi:hypothetical protein